MSAAGYPASYLGVPFPAGLRRPAGLTGSMSRFPDEGA